MDKIKCPPWLHEQPELRAILEYFITKLDVKSEDAWSHSPAITITKKHYPWLFSLDERSDRQWEFLQSLIIDYEIFTLKPDKKRNPLDPEFSNARLRLNLNAVDLLRRWLDRPLMRSSQEQWRSLIDRHITENTEQLKKRVITYEGKTLEEVILAFVQLGRYLDQQLSLRQLSANCFWGDSKVLEGREELIKSLYPNLTVSPRPIIINVFLPDKLDAVLFIENEDSYINAINNHTDNMCNMALIYSAGYKGTAERIRDVRCVSFHYQGAVEYNCLQRFEDWWFATADTQLPAYFWGDLDFAGMSILKTLKQRFNYIQAWTPGYQIMLQHLKNGNAHPLQSNNKGEQTDPVTTKCVYADSTLLPAIRQTQTYVDQEVVFWNDK